MAQLSQLSPEVIQEIIENLFNHRCSLWNLCLVGNHTITLIGQRFLWREVHWRWNAALLDSRTEDSADSADSEKCRRYQQQLVDYCSKEERTKSARYLNLEVFGLFSGDYSVQFCLILQKEMPKFINITHLRIGVSGAVMGLPSAQNVGDILHRLPALISLRLEGCKSQEKDFESYIPLPGLEALELWHCDEEYTCIARDAPDLRVLEVVGGDGEKFWRNDMHGVGIFGGYDSADSNLANFSSYRMRQKAEGDPDDEIENTDDLGDDNTDAPCISL